MYAPPVGPGGDMFRSRLRKKKEDAVSGFLGSQTEFTGKLAFSGVVHLDGNFDGEIISRGTLVVGGESVIRAQIYSNILKIAGEVHGDLNATERIELYPPAKVYGSIRTPSLIVEEGVIFEGNCRMSSIPAEVPALLEPEDDSAPEVEAISAHAWSPTYEDDEDMSQPPPEETSLPKLD
jgi:cytoskeletal protein CcmA (bactofilin family)